ncbi:hypothetical protein SAMN05444168_4716 [Paraburkholderia phenazinium]|jgi:hypothetical protein|uniref:Uncharacterized protein n=1 Tax=Paraburkholderia phenazinium TaxID=60549 RepID=A0A1N6JP92_9BURK|nr:hypothetical protein SAMN05444168_4716 [Paraburkholderia phenazinium]
MPTVKQAIAKRFIKAYLSLAAMIAFVLAVSLSRGAGWGVLVVGMPLFLTFFAGITYQLVVEIRSGMRKAPPE